jgi:hypothetical protein
MVVPMSLQGWKGVGASGAQLPRGINIPKFHWCRSRKSSCCSTVSVFLVGMSWSAEKDSCGSCWIRLVEEEDPLFSLVGARGGVGGLAFQWC